MKLNQTIQGDALTVLKTLPDESIDCVVTSPPYWGLRDYGVDGQIGLERKVSKYLRRLTTVFYQVDRVLKKDGTCWVNMGDSYRNDKNLLGIPWRFAFAMQARGWILRQDIIWVKPNPMPESVKDRCTKSHEYIFLFTKRSRYFFDQNAIKEPGKNPQDDIRRMKIPSGWDTGNGSHGTFHREGREKPKMRGHARQHDGLSKLDDLSKQDQCSGLRNKRSVWTVATNPFPEAHFATFPPKLIEPCILAGCPVGGVVLDPFHGSGTTGRVAIDLRRNYLGIELNAEYIKIDENIPKKQRLII